MVLQLPEAKFDAFREYLEDRGFTFEDREHQVFLARHEDVVVNLYESGKVVLGGSDELYQREIRWYLRDELGAKDPDAAEDLGIRGTRIGLDESGKGDYFGPLVACGVLVTQKEADDLLESGVKDSKALGDGPVRDLADEIRERLGRDRVRVVEVPPVKYNLLRREMDLNEMLGWAHARALEDLTETDVDVGFALADRFGDESYIASRLGEGGRDLRLEQIERAEREISVAAASVVARDRFLAAMERLGEVYGGTFPKGASQPVETFARELVNDYGPGALAATAKVHFRTTAKVVEDPGRVEAVVDELVGASAPSRELVVRAVIASLRTDLQAMVGDDSLGLRQLAAAIEDRWEEFEPTFGDADRVHQHLDRLAELEGTDELGTVLHHVKWLREQMG